MQLSRKSFRRTKADQRSRAPTGCSELSTQRPSKFSKFFRGRSRTPSPSSVFTVRLAGSNVNSAETLYGPGQEPRLHQAETTAADRIRAKVARDSGTLSGTVRPGTQRTRFADFFTRRTKATGTQVTNPNNKFEQLRRELMTRYPGNITWRRAPGSTQTHQAASRSWVQHQPAIKSFGGSHIENIMTAIAREYIQSMIGSRQPVHQPFNGRSLASPSALPANTSVIFVVVPQPSVANPSVFTAGATHDQYYPPRPSYAGGSSFVEPPAQQHLYGPSPSVYMGGHAQTIYGSEPDVAQPLNPAAPGGFAPSQTQFTLPEFTAVQSAAGTSVANASQTERIDAIRPGLERWLESQSLHHAQAPRQENLTCAQEYHGLQGMGAGYQPASVFSRA